MIVFERLSLNFHFIFVFSQAGNRRVKLCVLTNFYFFCHSRINGVQSKHENKTDRPKKLKLKYIMHMFFNIRQVDNFIRI